MREGLNKQLREAGYPHKRVTLENLIGECGAKLHSLWHPQGDERGEWKAMLRNGTHHIAYYGKSPIEAVAHAWLRRAEVDKPIWDKSTLS